MIDHTLLRLVKKQSHVDMVPFQDGGNNSADANDQLEELSRTLERERDILEIIMENVGISLAYLDNHFQFIKINTAFAKKLGYPKEFLIGKNYFDLYPNPEMLRIFTQVLESASGMEFFSKPFEQSSGNILYFDWTIVPVKSETDKVRGIVLSLNDVTEQVQSRRRLEDVLKQVRIMNEKLMSSNFQAQKRAAELDVIFSSMNDAVVIADNTGKIVQANPVAADFFGTDFKSWDLVQFLESAVFQHLNGTKMPLEEFPLQRALNGETITENYLRFLQRGGQDLTVLVSASPLIINNSIIGAVSTWRNVTEREKLHSQLEEERIRLRAILEQLPSGVIITEVPSGKILICNQLAIRIWRQPLISESSNFLKYSFLHLDGRPYIAHEHPLTRSISHGEVVNEEAIILRGDGTRGIVQINSAPILDRDGQIIAGVVIFSDITERKQDEEKIRLASQLQQIIEFLPNGVFVLDHNKKVIAWNRAIETMTGVKKADILGQDTYSVPFFGEMKPMLIDMIWESPEAEKTYPAVQHDGDTLVGEFFSPVLNKGKGSYLLVNVTPLNDSRGILIGAIESIQDITRQRKIEEESHRIQKIESIGVLAGGIAHDFNNFLAGILANIQLTKFKLAKKLDVTKTLDGIEDIIGKASDLTKQLLTFSKGGAPIKKTTSLVDLLRDTTEFILRGSKVKCLFNIPDNLWLADVDTGQISQVISNLVINAEQAMPDGGIIELSAQNFDLTPECIAPLTPGKYVKIVLTDHGTGIPIENLKKIFDPYFSTKEKGNGLGLTTAYAIIKNHSGHIGVQSEPGVGTTFHIYLPASTRDALPEKLMQTIIHTGQGRILIMDDEESIKLAAGEMLESIGYEVAYAADGFEAIKLFMLARETGKPFDALIMDLTIPGGLGGKETLEKLIKIDPAVKAVVSSGYSNDPVMADYLKFGFQGVVTKPYKIEELTEVLHRMLKKNELS